MKKIAKIVVLAGLTGTVCSPYICHAAPRSPFGQMRDFFDEFDRVFVQTSDIFDNQLHNTGIVVQDPNDNLKKMRESSQRIHQLTSTLLNNGTYQSADDAAKTFNQARTDITKEIQSLRDAVAKMDNTVVKTREFAQFSVKDFEKDDGKKYVVSVTLPGFSENDVTVKVVHRQGKELARGIMPTMLDIIAEKPKSAPRVKHESREDEKSTTVSTTESMRSLRMINGKRQEVMYDNGMVKVMCDLPDTIDEENYVMKFKDDTLTVEFEKKSTESRKRVLEFSK